MAHWSSQADRYREVPMSRSASVGAVLALACVAATATAAAQQLPSARIGIGAGVTSPRNAYHADELGEGFNTGWLGVVFLEFREPRRPIGVRVDVVIGENPANDAYNAAVSATAKTRLFGANVDLLYSFGRPTGGMRIYVLAGGGAFRNTLSAKSGGVAVEDLSENKWGWNAGAGITYPSGPGALFLEARYFSIPNTFISSGQAPFIALVGGFRFGRSKAP